MTLSDLFQGTMFAASNHPLVKPYMIAEAGVNHEGDMDLAKRLIEEAAEGGAQAIKFQSYKAETIVIQNSPSYWDLSKEPTTSQFELFKKYDRFWKSEFEKLASVCENAGIEFMSTPFDLESANFLNDLVKAHKISSSDITNRPFVEHIAEFGKPILLSTGASSLEEIVDAVDWIEKRGSQVALLHCVLNYPTPDNQAALGRIVGLKRAFPNHVIGYSDHTLPKDMQICISAGLLGATIIEKHFTHDKTLPGNDHYHAMDKEDLKSFHAQWDAHEQLLGDSTVTYQSSEEKSRKYARRSLVSVMDIPAGTVIEKSHLTWKRPAIGVCPSQIDRVIGQKTTRDIVADTPFEWNMFES